MMSRANLEPALHSVIVATAAKCKELCFVRKRNILRAYGDGNAAIIEFQRSTKSSRDKIVFTVNLGIICGKLLEPEEPMLEKARGTEAHLRQRVGMLLPGHPDQWWEITADTEVNALITEVSNLIVKDAAPYLLQYLQTDNIIALWQSKQSPGLTEKQRVRYLEKLKNGREDT